MPIPEPRIAETEYIDGIGLYHVPPMDLGYESAPWSIWPETIGELLSNNKKKTGNILQKISKWMLQKHK